MYDTPRNIEPLLINGTGTKNLQGQSPSPARPKSFKSYVLFYLIKITHLFLLN